MPDGRHFFLREGCQWRQPLLPSSLSLVLPPPLSVPAWPPPQAEDRRDDLRAGIAVAEFHLQGNTVALVCPTAGPCGGPGPGTRPREP